MTFKFFENMKNKAVLKELLRVQKQIDCELRTFTNHLKQISTEYQVLHEDNLKIIKLIEEKKK